MSAATGKERPGFMRLMALLGELGARCYATAGGLDEHGTGLAVGFWVVGKGGPVLVQQLSQGGYEVYVPITSDATVLSSELALLLYAKGEARSWLDALKSGAALDASLLVSATGLAALIERVKSSEGLPEPAELVELFEATAQLAPPSTGVEEQPESETPSSGQPAANTSVLEGASEPVSDAGGEP